VELDQRKTGNTLYLHLLWKRVRNSSSVAAASCLQLLLPWQHVAAQ
jgi:hypothetical protein